MDSVYVGNEAPRASAICERFVGSLRREYLDHMLVIGELQLFRVLKEYFVYFNPTRAYQGIAQQIPAPTVSPPGEADAGKVMAFPVLNGLHHDYRWAAAWARVGQKSRRMTGTASTGVASRNCCVIRSSIGCFDAPKCTAGRFHDA